MPRRSARSFNGLRARSESDMPSLLAEGKVASTKPFFLAHRYRSAHAVRFVQTQTFALRTAFILAHAQGRCASVIRNIRHLFGL